MILLPLGLHVCYWVAACQKVLAFLEAQWSHFYERGQFWWVFARGFQITQCDVEDEERRKTEEGEGWTLQSEQGHQGQETQLQTPHCSLCVCAYSPGPHRLQLQCLVKIISPGERKHTPINCSERDFSKALNVQLVLIHIDFNKIFLGQWWTLWKIPSVICYWGMKISGVKRLL